METKITPRASGHCDRGTQGVSHLWLQLQAKLSTLIFMCKQYHSGSITKSYVNFILSLLPC